MKKILVLIAFVFICGCAEHHNDMPEGYKLMCNPDGQYIWNGNGFSQRVGTSKQDAIDMAWEDYNQKAYIDCPNIERDIK